MIKNLPLFRLIYCCVLTVILLISTLAYQELLPITYASPFFNRQEITNPPDNWFLKKSGNGSSYIDTPNAGRVWVKDVDDIQECKTGDHFPFPSIVAVSYLSDGNTLNDTVWLSDKFYDPMLNNKPWSSSSFKDLILISTGYTMSIDVNSVYNQGTAYYVSIKWNINNQTWTRTVEEGSSTGEKRLIEKEENFHDFYENGKKYVTFYLDLKKTGSPDQYNFVVSTYDIFIKNNRLCYLIDISNIAQAPPPKFVISTNPNTVALRPGEEATLELQIKSTTDYKSNVTVSTSPEDSLQLDFISNSSYVPPLGESTIPLKIKALETAEPRSYTIPVIAKFTFPTKVTLRGGDLLSTPVSESITDVSNFVITVQPPLTLDDRFNNFWSVYGGALSVIIPIVIPGFGTLLAHRLIKKHRKKREQHKSTEQGESKKSSSRMPV